MEVSAKCFRYKRFLIISISPIKKSLIIDSVYKKSTMKFHMDFYVVDKKTGDYSNHYQMSVCQGGHLIMNFHLIKTLLHPTVEVILLLFS